MRLARSARGLAVLCVLLPIAAAAQGAAPAAGTTGSYAGSAAAPTTDIGAWERTARVSKIIGSKVRNRKGDTIGEIRDLVLDRNGRVSLAVLSTGGFLGVGDRLHAVPWEAFQAGTGDERILELDRTGLGKIPGFQAQDWPNLTEEKWLKENRRYYIK